MRKETKIKPAALAGKSLTQPLGVRAAEKFAAVEGHRLGKAAQELDKKLTARGLTGDAYRAEIIKAFKKGGAD